jgi:hypothetical protein
VIVLSKTIKHQKAHVLEDVLTRTLEAVKVMETGNKILIKALVFYTTARNVLYVKSR